MWRNFPSLRCVLKIACFNAFRVPLNLPLPPPAHRRYHTFFGIPPVPLAVRRCIVGMSEDLNRFLRARLTLYLLDVFPSYGFCILRCGDKILRMSGISPKIGSDAFAPYLSGNCPWHVLASLYPNYFVLLLCANIYQALSHMTLLVESCSNVSKYNF